LSSSRLLGSILDPLGLPFGSLLAPKMAETNPSGRLKMALEGSPLLFGLPEAYKKPPRALQEAFKRPSAAITHPRCNPKPYYIDVDLQKEVPEPQKPLNFIEKTMVFEEIAFSVRIASSTPFWTLLASISGAFWPPRPAQERPRPLQERPRRLQDRPRSAQDASKTTPRAAKRPPRALQESSKRASRGQDAPGGLQEAIWKQFRHNFGAMLGPFWS